jgi:hypothetical protein
MKTLNITDETYEELYKTVVPRIMQTHGAVNQDQIIKELIQTYIMKNPETKLEKDDLELLSTLIKAAKSGKLVFTPEE